jgi:hypothetical protein
VPAAADPASAPAPAPPVVTGAAPEAPATTPLETRPERVPRDTQAAAPVPDGDDDDSARWPWGLLAVAMIAVVVAASRRARA